MFIYSDDEHVNLGGKLAILEDCGFVRILERGELISVYRMIPAFVEHLRES